MIKVTKDSVSNVIFILYYLHGYGIPEIAKLLHRSYGYVKRRVDLYI